MSALGQKQTYAMQKAMSALPPIATVKADISKKACLLYPRKRTCAVHQPMSAMGQKQTLRHLWLTQPTWAPPSSFRNICTRISAKGHMQDCVAYFSGNRTGSGSSTGM
jgi:hypothetical protein